MKRLTVLVAGTALLASALGVGAAAAATAPANSAALTISPAGTKKATATWDDWATIEPGATFDAYWVVADDDATFTPFTADRGRFVDDTATRSVLFDDLGSATTYYFAVYAVDYTNTGVTVVPPSGSPADTPIGYTSATGSTLTINATKALVLTGKPLTLYGALTNGAGAAIAGADISVRADAYPYGDGSVETVVQTDADGKWSTPFSPTVNTRYWATYSPASGIGGWTRVVTVEVREKISVAVDPSLTVTAGTQVKFSGTLGGDPAFFAGVQACLQKFSSGWGSIKCVDVDTSGNYLLKYSPGAAADGKYRVWSGMGPAYADSWSRSKTLTVN